MAPIHKKRIIDGQDPDIGIGGYNTGGGHSPHSGLAADYISTFEVETPGGEVKVVVYPCQNEDL